MDLLQLADNGLWNKINSLYQTKGGVYKIIAVKDGHRVAVNRFLGTDDKGVLYIGKAASFLDRVIHLRTSIIPPYQSSSHGGGVKYKANPNIEKKFPINCLHLELVESEKPEELERKYLTEYAIIFGEVPPLNAI